MEIKGKQRCPRCKANWPYSYFDSVARSTICRFCVSDESLAVRMSTGDITNDLRMEQVKGNSMRDSRYWQLMGSYMVGEIELEEVLANA